MFRRLLNFVRSFFTDNRPPRYQPPEPWKQVMWSTGLTADDPEGIYEGNTRIGERGPDGTIRYTNLLADPYRLHRGGLVQTKEPPPLLINDYPEPYHLTREGRVVFDQDEAERTHYTRTPSPRQPRAISRASEAGIRAVREAVDEGLQQRLRRAEETTITGREILRKSLGLHTLPDGREGELSVTTLPATLPPVQEAPADPGDGSNGGCDSGD